MNHNYLSLNTLNGMFPSAGATLQICCRSLSSKKSVSVNMVSVTPAGTSVSSLLHSSSCNSSVILSLFCGSSSKYHYHFLHCNCTY